MEITLNIYTIILGCFTFYGAGILASYIWSRKGEDSISKTDLREARRVGYSDGFRDGESHAKNIEAKNKLHQSYLLKRYCAHINRVYIGYGWQCRDCGAYID